MTALGTGQAIYEYGWKVNKAKINKWENEKTNIKILRKPTIIKSKLMLTMKTEIRIELHQFFKILWVIIIYTTFWKRIIIPILINIVTFEIVYLATKNIVLYNIRLMIFYDRLDIYRERTCS